VAAAAQDQSDALVFFGATGDLAYKQIFPALAGLAARGRLDIPVIGVAKAGWDRDQLVKRAHESVADYGGADPCAARRLNELLRYVDGDSGTRAPSGRCGPSWGKRRRRCTTWPSRRRCSAPW
jgi:glucose-6-phosphate 1-dehydrogenase